MIAEPIRITNNNIDETERRQVIDAVLSRVADRHPGGANLTVLEQGVRHDQDWWYVPIQPDKQPAKRYEYYETLAEIENELQRDENMTVLFVPVRPDGDE